MEDFHIDIYLDMLDRMNALYEVNREEGITSILLIGSPYAH